MPPPLASRAAWRFVSWRRRRSQHTRRVRRSARLPGPFAAAPIVQGDPNDQDSLTDDLLSFPRGGFVGGTFAERFDGRQGSVVLWWTPEFDSAALTGPGDHYLWYASANYFLAYEYDNDRYNLTVGGQSLTVATALSAGTTYSLVARWDCVNTLDGTNYVALSIDDAHTFGVTAAPTPSSPAPAIYVGSDGATGGGSGIIEGLTIYRRPIYDGTNGIDLGYGDEVHTIFFGLGEDPARITGSWDVVFNLPTNSQTGALVSGDRRGVEPSPPQQPDSRPLEPGRLHAERHRRYRRLGQRGNPHLGVGAGGGRDDLRRRLQGPLERRQRGDQPGHRGHGGRRLGGASGGPFRRHVPAADRALRPDQHGSDRRADRDDRLDANDPGRADPRRRSSCRDDDAPPQARQHGWHRHLLLAPGGGVPEPAHEPVPRDGLGDAVDTDGVALPRDGARRDGEHAGDDDGAQRLVFAQGGGSIAGRVQRNQPDTCERGGGRFLRLWGVLLSVHRRLRTAERLRDRRKAHPAEDTQPEDLQAHRHRDRGMGARRRSRSSGRRSARHELRHRLVWHRLDAGFRLRRGRRVRRAHGQRFAHRDAGQRRQ